MVVMMMMHDDYESIKKLETWAKPSVSPPGAVSPIEEKFQ